MSTVMQNSGPGGPEIGHGAEAAPFSPDRRDTSRYDRHQSRYASIEEFLASGDPEAGIVSIETAEPIEILYQPAGSETTVVTFHAALARPKTPLPIFTGMRATSDELVNRIFISDPGLYAGDSVRVAWFAGTQSLPLQSVLPAVLAKLIDAAGGTRTLFWGPSAGGFAALYYSRLFPGSLAIPINPQTILTRFGEDAQRNYTAAAFGTESADEHDRVMKESICSDLRDEYAGELENYILYVQNGEDSHAEDHMKPFLDHIGESPRIKVVVGSGWGAGHVAPPPDTVRSIIGSMTAPDVSWPEYFSTSVA